MMVVVAMAVATEAAVGPVAHPLGVMGMGTAVEATEAAVMALECWEGVALAAVVMVAVPRAVAAATAVAVRAAERAEEVWVVGMVGAMEAVEMVSVAMAVATEAVGRQARRQCTHLDTKGQGARCHLD